MAANTLSENITLAIKNADGSSFYNLSLKKFTVDSQVMSLGDKITGDVYYKDNNLPFTMREYVEYDGVKYTLVNPPTVVKEGMVRDNSENKGMTKYSLEFYHPMCQLANFPFADVATKTGEEKYLSQNKSFSWIGKPQDYIDKLNKNLQGAVWYVRKSDRFPVEKDNELSDVLTFDNVTVADAIKTGYDTWGVAYVVSQLPITDQLYAQGKRFVVEYGLPSNEIYENESARQLGTPFVFQMGQGVGLKNNSRTPRNNKIVTRIAGYGSEDNVPYGYPQIIWYGDQDWNYTKSNDPNDPLSYSIYKGIVGGQYVKLIKHPFTRTHLMPSIYSQTVFNKVSPYLSNGQENPSYNPAIEIKDYYDAIATQEYPYVNEINLQAPSYESHEFPDIKPELDSEGNVGIISATPLDKELQPTDKWDDTMDDDGNYLQITLPQLGFDLYACAAITQEMQINMRSGACIGCTFTVQVDWDDYKKNFYDSGGNFLPDGEQRDLGKYPKSNLGQISIVVQKDNTTFGVLMPNIYQQPKANDLFVFIGISLPLSYITSAETRLDSAMKSYMLENNVYYFDYPLKFDEHFLATHTYILEQIRPNSIIHFDYGGVEQQLFVKQLTVKYGNAPLPQYDITLTDNIEVVLNQIGQVADDVEHLGSLISILRQEYGRNVWNEISKKLSKVNDDTAQGFIGFAKGLWVKAKGLFGFDADGNIVANTIKALSGLINSLQSANYKEGELMGTGYQLTNDNGEGLSKLEADIIVARTRFIVNELQVRKYVAMGGNYVFSPAASQIERVDYYDANGNLLGYDMLKVPLMARIGTALKNMLMRSGNTTKVLTIRKFMRTTDPIDMSQVAFFRCWIKADDGTTRTINTWQSGMLARCQTADIEEINGREGGKDVEVNGKTSHGNVFYWRLVKAAGQGKFPDLADDDKVHSYVDLSNFGGTEAMNYADREYASGSMAPAAGDDIVCFGATKRAYSNLTIIETTTSDAPAIKEYYGIGLRDNARDNTTGEPINWSLDGKEVTKISPKGDIFTADHFSIRVNGQDMSLNAYFDMQTDNIMFGVNGKLSNPNLFLGIDDGEGWQKSSISLIDNCISLSCSGISLIAPPLQLSAGNYTLSFVPNSDSANNITVTVKPKNGDPTSDEVSKSEFGQAKVIPFTLFASDEVTISWKTTNNVAFSITKPKLETGLHATSWEQGAIGSQIKMTADNIQFFVTNGLSNTGINIVDKKINLIADKTTFSTTDDKQMIAVQMCDANGNVGNGAQYNIPSIVFYDGEIGQENTKKKWVLNYLGFIAATNAGVRFTFTERYDFFCFDMDSGEQIEHRGITADWYVYSNDMLYREFYSWNRQIESMLNFTSGYYVQNGQIIYQPTNGIYYQCYNGRADLPRFWLTDQVSIDFVPNYEPKMIGNIPKRDEQGFVIPTEDSTNAPCQGYYYTDVKDYGGGSAMIDIRYPTAEQKEHYTEPTVSNRAEPISNDPWVVIDGIKLITLVHFNDDGVIDARIKDAIALYFETNSTGQLAYTAICINKQYGSGSGDRDWQRSVNIQDVIDAFSD